MKNFLSFLLLSNLWISVGLASTTKLISPPPSCPKAADVIEAIKKDYRNLYSKKGVLTIAGYPWHFDYETHDHSNDFWTIFQETQSNPHCQLYFADAIPCRYVIGRNEGCTYKGWAILAITYEG